MSGYRRSSGSSGSSDQHQYKGVRMRRWGKWVSEIREPQKKKRIWLGSYRSAEEAAHAYDAALLCLRGPAANLNFPNNRPTLPPGSPGNYSTREVQAAAAAAAAASVGRRFSYSEFMSPKSTSDSSSDEEVEDITYNRDQPTSYGETWRSTDDDPYLYPDMARGMLIRPPVTLIMTTVTMTTTITALHCGVDYSSLITIRTISQSESINFPLIRILGDEDEDMNSVATGV